MEIEPTVGSELPQEPLKIFPLGAEPVRTVIKAALRDFQDKGWDVYLDVKIPMLEDENPFVNKYLLDMADDFDDEDEGTGFKIGVTLGYEVIRERAGGKTTCY